MKKSLLFCLTLLLVVSIKQSQAQVQMMPLFEEFTSSTCGPCAANNPTFDAMCDNNTGTFVSVKYQMNWPGSGDPYYNADGNMRKAKYACNSIPDLKINGDEFGAPAGFTQGDLGTVQSYTTHMVIDAHYELTGTTVHITGNVLPQQDYVGAIRLYIAAVEDPTYNNASSNGETQFHYVEQKMIPSGTGVILSGLTNGASIPINQTYNLSGAPNIEDINNVQYAVWVQNYASNELYQSTWATIATGIAETENTSSGIVSISPNPSSEQATVLFSLMQNAPVKFSVHNSLGQLIEEKDLGMNSFGLHNEKISTQNWSAGIYFVDVQIGSNNYRQPLIVQ